MRIGRAINNNLLIKWYFITLFMHDARSNVLLCLLLCLLAWHLSLVKGPRRPHPSEVSKGFPCKHSLVIAVHMCNFLLKFSGVGGLVCLLKHVYLLLVYLHPSQSQ